MSKYTVVLLKSARKQLDKLPDNIVTPLLAAILTLEGDPRPMGYKKLKDREGYRIRVHNYRIIYTIQDKILLVAVITIGHRRDVYG
ncbi:MAG: type II toxin-antitoxin system RelE/ParE family toxin [Bacteroidota bacterium]|nr:type II toxin-antitoxin system RelE/ParE family toxin [Bacteroidota bacterium]